MAGVADALAEAGIRCFGPTAAAAALEGSKAFCKEVMARRRRADGGAQRRHGRRGRAGRDRPLPGRDQGRRAGGRQGGDDRRGRGSRPAARSKRCSSSADSAPSGWWSRSISRARSCRCWRCATARTAVPLASAQDYKRIFDGDRGPNTGGMGSYSPVPAVDADRAQELCRTIHQPVLDELARRGTPFHGVLYAGLMLTARRAQGARVQRPLRRPRDAGDPAAAASRTCSSCSRPPPHPAASRARSFASRTQTAVTVVLASRGYPESSVQRRCDHRPRPGARRRVRHARRHGPRARRRASSPPAAGC